MGHAGDRSILGVSSSGSVEAGKGAGTQNTSARLRVRGGAGAAVACVVKGVWDTGEHEAIRTTIGWDVTCVAPLRHREKCSRALLAHCWGIEAANILAKPRRSRSGVTAPCMNLVGLGERQRVLS